MKYALLALALLSFNSFAAEKVLLKCSTSGFGLAELRIVQSGKDGKIMIKMSEDEEEEFVSFEVSSSLKNIEKGDSDTLVGTSSLTEEAGGTKTNAIMLRVKEGQKGAFLAMEGDVHTLICSKE